MSTEAAEWAPVLILAYGLYVVAIAGPGPLTLSVVNTTLADGPAAGKAHALGIATGSLAWGLATWSGAVSLLLLDERMLWAVRLVGAGYLAWLAWRAFFSAIAPRRAEAVREPAVEAGPSYRRGLVLQLANPKALFGWITVMAIVLGDEAPLWVGGTMVALGAATSAAVHLAYATVVTTRGVAAAYGRWHRWVDAGLAVFFAFACIELLIVRL